MFSLQKIFAKDKRLFELLEASAGASQASIRALKHILAHRDARHDLDEFVAARRKDKQVTGEINEFLARTAVTALDREDIESISRALYKIPKTVEKFAERYLIVDGELKDIDFDRHIVLLETATNTVAAMIKELEKSRFELVKQQNETLQTAEGDADKLMLELIKEMYNGKYPPLKVFILKDLYELLERVVDRCRDVGNVVANVVLKHS